MKDHPETPKYEGGGKLAPSPYAIARQQCARALIKACESLHDACLQARAAGGEAYLIDGSEAEAPFDYDHPLYDAWYVGFEAMQTLGQRAVLPSANHATGVAVDAD